MSWICNMKICNMISLVSWCMSLYICNLCAFRFTLLLQIHQSYAPIENYLGKSGNRWVELAFSLVTKPQKSISHSWIILVLGNYPKLSIRHCCAFGWQYNTVKGQWIPFLLLNMQCMGLLSYIHVSLHVELLDLTKAFESGVQEFWVHCGSCDHFTGVYFIDIYQCSKLIV